MLYLKSYSEINEGWKNILFGALIGLTTACQKADLEDEFGNKLPVAHVNDLAKVQFVDSISANKFRIEAKFPDNRVIYFDNPLKLDTGQTVYIHTDEIGRLLATPVSNDFSIPNRVSNSDLVEFRINYRGETSLRGSKVKIQPSSKEALLKNLKQLRTKSKSKFITAQVDAKGNIVSFAELDSIKSIKPQPNLVILKARG